MNRLRNVCIRVFERGHAHHYAISRVAIPYVTQSRSDFYLANVDATDGYLVFERHHISSSAKPSTLSDSWYQL